MNSLSVISFVGDSYCTSQDLALESFSVPEMTF